MPQQKSRSIAAVLLTAAATITATVVGAPPGQAHPVIDTVLPLQDVGKAHDRLDSHHGRGKIVLQVGSDR